MKTCSNCKIEKEFIEFSKWKYSKDGHRNECKSCDKIRSKTYALNNVEKEKKRRRERYLKNKEREIAYDKEYKKRRESVDPTFKLIRRLRDRHSKAVKSAGKLKNFRTTDLLGCDSKTLKNHFEGLFKHDMSWDNYNSVWHIDHVYPLSKVNWEDETQISLACNFKNLIPQYKEVNWSKGSKLNFY